MEEHKHGCGFRGHKNELFLEVSLLLVLARGRGYGYALLADLSLLGMPEDDLNMGTLYRRLRRMEEDGLVASSWEESGAGPNRRVYDITSAGGQELDRWMEILKGRKARIETLVSAYKNLPAGQGLTKQDKEGRN